MTPSTLLIVNTLAQNIRSVINICLSLYSTRMVMNILGQSDYGIYMLVAGVVSFLSYFTTALVTTTQRHLSYSYGQKNLEVTKRIFENSYLTNCLVGIISVLFLLSLSSFLFNGTTLNIASEKYEEAKWVYLIILSSVFLSFATAPFKALFIARENIVYISIIDVLDGILKVSLIFILYLFDEHRLIVYSCIISMVMLFNFLALSVYAKMKYQECCLVPNPAKYEKNLQKTLIDFTAWTLYGSISLFFRNQGIAIFLNRALGTIVNASYGIATQILGSIVFLSSAIMNAFTPQIVKAEGEGDREQMLYLCLKACMYSYLLLSIVSFPLIFEIDEILQLWLGNIPEYASLFCRIFLISAIIDQLTTGLNVANQALGKIRNYTLLVYTIKLLTLPAVWYVMKLGFELSSTMIVYLSFEVVSAAIRIPYIAQTTGLSINKYLHKVFYPLLAPSLIAICICYMMTMITAFPFRFIFTGIASAVSMMIVIWYVSFDHEEKDYIRTKFLSKLYKKY